jgi:GR25 family glycosyltransferase involved in LPS biosynthesis
MERAENIFIVNLKKDEERWKKCIDELNKYPINYRRFNAVNGKDLSEEEINNKVSWWGRNLLCNRSIIGCFLSHTNLWKQLLNDKNNDFYLIFEDDFVINDFNTLNKLYNLYLQQKIDKNFLSFFLTHSDYKTGDIIDIDGVKICKKLFHISQVGYFITKKGAMDFLNRLGDKIHYHIDNVCCILSKIYPECEIWHTEKNLVSLNETGLINSNISGNSKKKTLLSYILNDKNYSNFRYPLLIFRMKYNFTVEAFFSLLLFIVFFTFAKNTKLTILYLLSILFLINFVLCF